VGIYFSHLWTTTILTQKKGALGPFFKLVFFMKITLREQLFSGTFFPVFAYG